jgi:hypothetical protein
MLRSLCNRIRPNVSRFFSQSRLTSPKEITSSLNFSLDNPTIETFALTNLQGNLLPGVSIEESEKEVVKDIYRLICEMEVIDDFMNKAQRQGEEFIWFVSFVSLILYYTSILVFLI